MHRSESGDGPARRNSAVGGIHRALHADDFEAALTRLIAQGVRITGEPTVRTTGPSAGQTWVYFLAPGGLQLELDGCPDGKGEGPSTAYVRAPVGSADPNA
ncbi:VOC family protein [Streptomyces sp. NPDC001970]